MEKIIMLTLITMLAASSMGAALAMWSDSLRVNTSIHMGRHDPVIGSYKVFKCVPCGCLHGCGAGCGEVVKTPKKLSLNLTGVSNETTIWVGLVLENNGTLRSTFTGVNVLGPSSGQATIEEILVYGPYKHGEFAGTVWCHMHCSNLPPAGGSNPPQSFHPDWKMVVWIKIGVNGDPVNDPFTVDIEPVFQAG